MGTNYYLYENICPHCGRSDDPLHIGKSSAGWCFALHVIPEKGIFDLPDWQRQFPIEGSQIKDEYGNSVYSEDLLPIIRDRSGGPRSKQTEEWYAANYAEPGPNGLARHKIMFPPTNGCIGHGAGTWDLIAGEFS